MNERQARIEDEAERLGFENAGTTGSGHKRWKHPATGATVITPSTAGRGRSQQNAIAELRRRAKPAQEDKSMQFDKWIQDAIDSGPKTVRSAVLRILKAAKEPVRSGTINPVAHKLGNCATKGAAATLASHTLVALVEDPSLPVFRLKRGVYVYDKDLMGASLDALSEAAQQHKALWGAKQDEAYRARFLARHGLAGLAGQSVSKPASPDEASSPIGPKTSPAPRRITASEEAYEEIGRSLTDNVLVRSTQGSIYELVPIGQSAGGA
jgi:hypothetical protein